MTVNGGVTIGGLIQGLPQGDVVIAQMTIPASQTPQPTTILTISSTTGVQATAPSTANGVLIIPPTSAISLTLNTGTNTTVVLTLGSGGVPTVIPLSGAQSIYLGLSTGTAAQVVQVIFF